MSSGSALRPVPGLRGLTTGFHVLRRGLILFLPYGLAGLAPGNDRPVGRSHMAARYFFLGTIIGWFRIAGPAGADAAP